MMAETQEKGMHICSNCGASFPETEAYCPYCGVINPAGAEEQYMDRLHGIREDLAELADDHEEALQGAMKHIGKRSLRALIMAGIVILGLVFIGLMYGRSTNRRYKEEMEAEAQFAAAYFEELNTLDAAGDDDTTLARIDELLEEDGAAVLYEWTPYRYYRQLEFTTEVEELLAEYTAGQMTRATDLSLALALAYDVTRDTYFQPEQKSLRAERRAKVEACKASCEAALKEILQVGTSGEVDAFFEEIRGKNSTFYDPDLLDQRAEELMKARKAG